MEHYVTTQTPASSCMAFVASMQARYRELAQAPEETTNSDKRDMQNLQTYALYERHKNGETVNSLAKSIGLSQPSLARRFRRRGLEVFMWGSGNKTANRWVSKNFPKKNALGQSPTAECEEPNLNQPSNQF